jgi:hypothetical protein
MGVHPAFMIGDGMTRVRQERTKEAARIVGSHMDRNRVNMVDQAMSLTDEMKSMLRIPYALRRVPEAKISCLLRYLPSPRPGDIVLTRLEKIGRNSRLELASGRTCNLHEGDLLAVTFGNRYASQQFEGYARSAEECCDLLSMGGVCGLVTSKHAGIAEPSKLRQLGALGDAQGRALHLRDFALPPPLDYRRPFIVVVVGSAMDTGKTHTATSLIVGLRRQDRRVAAIKLTGTAAGRDLWKVMDTGACAALDFVDGGYPSTYLCPLEELLDLHQTLVSHAVSKGADWVVIEIADGLLQRETAGLLQSAAFKDTVDAWVFATNDPLGAVGGICTLRGWGITPVTISGLISMSPLAMQETKAATGMECVTAGQLEGGVLNERFLELAGERA